MRITMFYVENLHDEVNMYVTLLSYPLTEVTSNDMGAERLR